jgi:hypothetical protein
MGGTAADLTRADRSAQARVYHQQITAGRPFAAAVAQPTAAQMLATGLRAQSNFVEEQFHQLAYYLAQELNLHPGEHHDSFATVQQALTMFMEKAAARLGAGAPHSVTYGPHRLELCMALVCQELFSCPQTMHIMPFDGIKQLVLVSTCHAIGIDLGHDAPEQRTAKRLTPERYKQLGWQCLAFQQYMPLWGNLVGVFDHLGLDEAKRNAHFDTLSHVALKHNTGSLSEHIPGAAMVQLIAHAYPGGKLAIRNVSQLLTEICGQDQQKMRHVLEALNCLERALDTQPKLAQPSAAGRQSVQGQGNAQQSRLHRSWAQATLESDPIVGQVIPRTSTPQPPQLPPMDADFSFKRRRVDTRASLSPSRTGQTALVPSTDHVLVAAANAAARATLGHNVQVPLHRPTHAEFKRSLFEQRDVHVWHPPCRAPNSPEMGQAPYCKKTYNLVVQASERVIGAMGEDKICSGAYSVQCFRIYVNLLHDEIRQFPQTSLNTEFHAAKLIALAYCSVLFDWKSIDSKDVDMTMALKLNPKHYSAQKQRLDGFRNNMPLLAALFEEMTAKEMGPDTQRDYLNALVTLSRTYQESQPKVGNLSAIDLLIRDASIAGKFNRDEACVMLEPLLIPQPNTKAPREKKPNKAVFTLLASTLERMAKPKPVNRSQPPVPSPTVQARAHTAPEHPADAVEVATEQTHPIPSDPLVVQLSANRSQPLVPRPAVQDRAHTAPEYPADAVEVATEQTHSIPSDPLDVRLSADRTTNAPDWELLYSLLEHDPHGPNQG